MDNMEKYIYEEKSEIIYEQGTLNKMERRTKREVTLSYVGDSDHRKELSRESCKNQQKVAFEYSVPISSGNLIMYKRLAIIFGMICGLTLLLFAIIAEYPICLSCKLVAKIYLSGVGSILVIALAFVAIPSYRTYKNKKNF